MKQVILNFFAQGHTPEEFTAMLRAVKSNTTTHLKLDQILIDKFGGEGDSVISKQLLLLGDALKQNSSVIVIELGGTSFPQDIFLPIINALKTNNNIQTLVVDITHDISHSHQKALAEMLRVNTGLKTLTIELCCLEDSIYVKEIAEMLRLNKTLEVLGLRNPLFLDEATQDILCQLPDFNDSLQKIILYTEYNPKEFINPSWEQRHLKNFLEAVSDKSANTFFQSLPVELIDRLKNYLHHRENKATNKL